MSRYTILLLVLTCLAVSACSINNLDEEMIAEGRRASLFMEAERQGILNQHEKQVLAQEREDQQKVLDASLPTRIAAAIRFARAEGRAKIDTLNAEIDAKRRFLLWGSITAVIGAVGIALLLMGFGIERFEHGLIVATVQALTRPQTTMEEGRIMVKSPSPLEVLADLQGASSKTAVADTALPAVWLQGDELLTAPGNLPAIGAQFHTQLEATKAMALAAREVGRARAAGDTRTAALETLHAMVKDILNRGPQISVVDGAEIVEAE